MRVFLTGATGLIGSALVSELINAGDQVLGLTRSESGSQILLAAGAQVLQGGLADVESLRSGAKQSDGVIHCALDHENFEESARLEKRAIAALGGSLAGSDRPLTVSTGLGLPSPKRPITEDVEAPAVSPTPRSPEQAAHALTLQGVNVTVVRVPQVHNRLRQGLVTTLIAVARQKGVSAYVGDGLNRWPAAHVTDVAHLYRLALEKREPSRYHAVAEEGILLRDIANAVSRGLKVPVVSIPPEEAPAHFGRIGGYVGLDLSASSVITQQRLGWLPTGPGLLQDLDEMSYFED